MFLCWTVDRSSYSGLLFVPLAFIDHPPNLVQMPLPLLPAFLPTPPEGVFRLLHLGEGSGIQPADLDAAHDGVDLEFMAAPLKGSATLNRAYHEASRFATQTQGKVRLNLVTRRLLNDSVNGQGQIWSKKDVNITHRSLKG